MRRLLHLATAQHSVAEIRPGGIVQSTASRLLVEEKPLQLWMARKTDEG